MRRSCHAAALGLLLCGAAGAAEVAPVFAPIKDDPRLPRVLLIGDSISIGYTLPVRKLLEGKANVHRPPENCQSTVYARERIKDWLGDGKWDVIHFNWGIWDSHHFRAGGVRTTPEQYEKNLRELVSILKATRARLIWATTTPLATRWHGDLMVKDTDVPLRNAIAKKVMDENGIPSDDLYTAVLPRIAELRAEDGCHYTAAGSDFLAERVAQSVNEELAKRQHEAGNAWLYGAVSGCLVIAAIALLAFKGRRNGDMPDPGANGQGDARGDRSGEA